MLEEYRVKSESEKLLNRFANCTAFLATPGLNEEEKQKLTEIRNDIKTEIIKLLDKAMKGCDNIG